MTDKKSKDKGIVYTASIIGTLVALLIVIIAAHSLFPPVMFQAVVVVLLVLIIIVNGYGVFGQSLIRFFKKIRMARKHRALTEKYFYDFDRFVDKLGELLEPRRCDNIPYTLNKIQNKELVFRDILLPSVYDFHDLFVVFMDAFGKLRRNEETFLLLIKWFGSLLNSYNKQYICNPVERTRNILRRRTAGIPEDIKEEYKQHKVGYDKFILEYMDFAKGINKDFGKRAAREYFDMPKGLEL